MMTAGGGPLCPEIPFIEAVLLTKYLQMDD